MNRKRNKTEDEYIIELIDEGASFEDQCTYQLSMNTTKSKAEKGQNVLNKEMEKDEYTCADTAGRLSRRQ